MVLICRGLQRPWPIDLRWISDGFQAGIRRHDGLDTIVGQEVVGVIRDER